MTVTVLAIDPGPERSAYVLYDGERGVRDFQQMQNLELLTYLKIERHLLKLRLAIEGVQSFGMPVGREVFDTCIWIGRFIEAFGGSHTIVYRSDVKLHLCRSARAKDPMIRQALIDRFGPGRDKAVGKKKTPGPLYGIASHCWSALAVAVYWHDTHGADYWHKLESSANGNGESASAEQDEIIPLRRNRPEKKGKKRRKAKAR